MELGTNGTSPCIQIGSLGTAWQIYNSYVLQFYFSLYVFKVLVCLPFFWVNSKVDIEFWKIDEMQGVYS